MPQLSELASSRVRTHVTQEIDQLEAMMTRILEDHFSRQAGELTELLASIGATDGGPNQVTSQFLETQVRATAGMWSQSLACS